jgi:hypothetical protein
MMIQFHSISAIDLMVAHLEEYGGYCAKKLKGKDRNAIEWARIHQAEASHIFEALSDSLHCPVSDLLAVAHIVARWYKKTNWQYCLTESMADALIEGAMNCLLREPKPTEPGYYAAWAARNRAFRQRRSA